MYSQGAWQPATSGAITADDFEFLSLALRRAQSYFWAMGRNEIAREFNKVAWELQVILSMPSDEALLEWQLSEVNNLKPEQKSKSWWLGLSELCRDLRKVLADHSRVIIKSFLRWSDSAMQDKRKPGISFQDCSVLRFRLPVRFLVGSPAKAFHIFTLITSHDAAKNSCLGYLSTKNGRVRQLTKDPRRGCYIYVPAQIAWKAPDLDRQRLAALLLSSFAGTDALRMILAQTALSMAHMRQPEVIHVIAGTGADGKTMIMVDLLKATFGASFGNPSCTLLQVGQ